jgi:hypothetical protein
MGLRRRGGIAFLGNYQLDAMGDSPHHASQQSQSSQLPWGKITDAAVNRVRSIRVRPITPSVRHRGAAVGRGDRVASAVVSDVPDTSGHTDPMKAPANHGQSPQAGTVVASGNTALRRPPVRACDELI